MIIWINGAFGAGKTTTAYELNRRLSNSFIYDPEDAGYFIRRNTNDLFSDGDFQDISLWREINYQLLHMISKSYDGIVIVPMTLVNPVYYNEIVERLVADGVDVRHFILYAKREVIKHRIKKRRLPLIGGSEDFALDAIDRCIDFFDNHVKDVKIDTENMSIEHVVEEIASLSNFQLSPDKRLPFSKFLCRLYMMIKRI